MTKYCGNHYLWMIQNELWNVHCHNDAKFVKGCMYHAVWAFFPGLKWKSKY